LDGEGFTKPRPHRDEETVQEERSPSPFKRRDREEAIPFENIALPNDAGVDLDNSTVTPRERKAFEKLFTLKKSKPAQSTATPPKASTDDGVDSILAEAVANTKKPRRRPEKSVATPAQAKPDKETDVEANRVRVAAIFDRKDNDTSLWHELQMQVLTRLASLPLNRAPSDKEKVDDQSADRAIKVLTANAPGHLVHFMRTSRIKFPGSPLCLNLIPKLKELGPGAFALGASTGLYNEHLLALHRLYPTDLESILDVLAEMDREVYEYDDETLEVIGKTLKDINMWRSGHEGPAVQIVFGTERVERCVSRLRKVAEVVKERREDAALRAVREAEAERREG